MSGNIRNNILRIHIDTAICDIFCCISHLSVSQIAVRKTLKVFFVFTLETSFPLGNSTNYLQSGKTNKKMHVISFVPSMTENVLAIQFKQYFLMFLEIRFCRDNLSILTINIPFQPPGFFHSPTFIWRIRVQFCIMVNGRCIEVIKSDGLGV